MPSAPIKSNFLPERQLWSPLSLLFCNKEFTTFCLARLLTFLCQSFLQCDVKVSTPTFAEPVTPIKFGKKPGPLQIFISKLFHTYNFFLLKKNSVNCRDLQAQTDIVAEIDSWYLSFHDYVTNNFLKGSGESSFIAFHAWITSIIKQDFSIVVELEPRAEEPKF